jgi:hypothetical protein
MSRNHIVRAGAVIWLISSSLDTTNAQNPVGISGVTVRPADIIYPDDLVSLSVELISGSSSIQLFAPTEVHIAGNDVLVNVFAHSGLVFIPDARTVIVPLGHFRAGTYNYTVTQNRPTHPGELQVFGSFRVVPEPNSALLVVGFTLSAFAVRRRPRI